ncbi:MAG: serine/threonine-protein kinase [Myxococcales bacterium]
MSAASEPIELGGRYRLVRELGRGGMACVYLARDQKLLRDVAVKMLPPGVLDEALAKRLEREARLAAAVNHPNAVAVYDFGSEQGRPYLVSEYVEGSTLAGLFEKRPTRLAEVAALLLHPVASALGAAHARGLVHRDVKPANVLVSRDGQVKLADFGIAIAKAATSRLTAEGALTGSLPYLAPERIDGREAEPPSDVFAAGVSWYELAAGELPFKGDSPAALAAAVLAGRLRPLASRCPSVPPALEELCHLCLASDPAARPRDGAELARLLAAALAEEGIAHPAAELPLYFLSADGYEAALAERQGQRCAALARAASGRGDLAASARLASRAVAYRPGLALAELVTPMRRRRLARALWLAGAAVALAGGVAWSLRERPAIPAAPIAPVLAVERREASPSLPPLPSPAGDADSSPSPTKSLSAAVRPPRGAEQQAARGARRESLSPPPVPPAPARLHLTTEPWAQVFIDGRSVGYTPTVHDLTLDPGRHTLRLVNPYYQTREQPLDLAAGEVRDLDLALDPPRPGPKP